MNKRLLRVLQSMPIQDATWIDCYNNIYDDKVAGTLRTTINSSNMFFIMETAKDNREPQVLAPKRNDYARVIRKDYEAGKVKDKLSNLHQYEPREDVVSNTITSFLKDNYVAEPSIIGRPHGYYKGGEYNVSPTVKSSAMADNNYVKDVDFRIRKLTPRECFRLMDVDDADIDKLLEAKIPNTQLYKLAGNSIVVAVLERIFDKMFVNTEITDWTIF